MVHGPILTPFVFTLITTILVLHIVWVVNVKEKDRKLIGLAFGTYMCYLLTFVLLSYGHGIPAGIVLGIGTLLLIVLHGMGGVGSWEAGWALGLGLSVCLLTFGSLIYLTYKEKKSEGSSSDQTNEDE